MANKATLRQKKSDAIHRTSFSFSFGNVNDADVIEKLNSVPNKQGYIKNLIRADIIRQQTIAELKGNE